MTKLFKVSVDYDPTFDLFSAARPGFKSTYSLEAGKFVLDYFKDDLIGFEIEKAAETLSQLFGFKITKDDIERNIKNVKLGFKKSGNMTTVVVSFIFKNEEKKAVITIPLSEKSPALSLN